MSGRSTGRRARASGSSSPNVKVTREVRRAGCFAACFSGFCISAGAGRSRPLLYVTAFPSASVAQISLWAARRTWRKVLPGGVVPPARLGGSLPAISMKELLEAGVHFGHQTRRWNPKMKDYIFGERNGIYIIDLQKTLKLFKDASKFVTDLCAGGKTILFVGTKRQAQDAVAEEATRAGMPYINNRWLGGLLTNWVTVQKSVKRLQELDDMATDGRYELLTKKEVIKLERERKHLQANLAGIKSMKRLPDALFIVDSNNEAIAVKEARKLGIPVVAVVDTNCDPTVVDYVI